MPSRKGGRKQGGGRDSAVMTFHYTFSAALVAGAVAINGTPATLSPRATIEADAWAHFRLKKLRFRMLPTSPITAPQAAGWVGGIQDTPPTTFATIAELVPSTVKGVGQTVPSPWVNVPKSDLAGPFPWYKTVAGTADATEESPGAIYLVGTGTEAYILELKFTIEFKTAVSSLNTPLFLQLKEAVRKERVDRTRRAERDVLLKILGTVNAP